MSISALSCLQEENISFLDWEWNTQVWIEYGTSHWYRAYRLLLTWIFMLTQHLSEYSPPPFWGHWGLVHHPFLITCPWYRDNSFLMSDNCIWVGLCLCVTVLLQYFLIMLCHITSNIWEASVWNLYAVSIHHWSKPVSRGEMSILNCRYGYGNIIVKTMGIIGIV